MAARCWACQAKGLQLMSDVATTLAGADAVAKAGVLQRAVILLLEYVPSAAARLAVVT